MSYGTETTINVDRIDGTRELPVWVEGEIRISAGGEAQEGCIQLAEAIESAIERELAVASRPAGEEGSCRTD